MKSEFSSRKRACFSAASCCLSVGRSRGSWMVSAAARIMTSRTQPRLPDSTIIRPSRGSTGSWASCCPTAVSPPPSSVPAAPAVVPAAGHLAAGAPVAVARLLLRPRGAQGAQLAQEGDAVVDGPGVRRLHEREVLHILGPAGDAHGGHLEDDGGEVGAQDFGIGERRPGLEVLLRVQPDGDAVGDAAAAAGALVGGCLRDPLDRQALDLGAVRVPGDAGGAGVDDVFDAGNRQGGLGDVGGEHDPALAAGVEDLVLFLQAQPGEEREHLGAGQLPVGLDPAVEGLGGVADFAFAGEEDQDVAGRLLREFVDGVADGVQRIAVLLQLVVGGGASSSSPAAPPAGWDSGR